MSISSGSDITIPIQDSPPPPPSPYGNSKGHGGIDPEAGGSGSRMQGIDNKSFNGGPSSLNAGDEKKCKSGGKTQTEIPMDHYTESGGTDSSPKVTEAVNTELVQGVNVLDTIPHKPQSEFGPYEKFPEYFISVNQHKKFFTRGEKLSVTKDKRRSSKSLKKYICWILGGLIIAAIITVAVLAAVGFIPEKSGDGTFSKREMTTSTGNPDDLSSFSSTEIDLSSSSFPPVTPQVTEKTTEASTSYVPNSADVELRFKDAEFDDDLEDPTTSKFKSLATDVERQVKQKLEAEEDVDLATARVTEFRSGSIIAKLRIGWSRIGVGEETPDFRTIQTLVSSWTEVGNFTLGRGTVLYPLYNSCKLSNGGCSHNCAFDESSLDFMCTCPEDKLLDEDKKTCIDPPTHAPEVLESSTELSSEPPVEPLHVTTSTTTTVPPTAIPVSEPSVPEEHETTVSTTTTTSITTEVPTPIVHEVTPQQQPLTSTTEEPLPETTSPSHQSSSEESHPSEEVTPTAHPEDVHVTPQPIPAEPTTGHVTPEPAPAESTSHVTPENVPAEPITNHVATNETEGSHSIEQTEPSSGSEEKSTTLEPPPTNTEIEQNVTAIINHEGPQVITVTVMPSEDMDLVTTTVSSTTSAENHLASEDHPAQTNTTVETQHETTAEVIEPALQTLSQTEEMEITTIPPHLSHAADDEGAQHSTSRKSSRAFDSSETSSIQIDPTREPLLNRHSSQSDEFMVYSDMELAHSNVSTTLATSVSSDEVINSMSQEEISHELINSGEHRTDDQPQFQQLIIPRREVMSLVNESSEREREEMTTTLPMSYVNDTIVNEMIENATEDLDSEPLAHSQGSSQESSAEGVVVEANSSGESSQHLEQDQVPVTHPPVSVEMFNHTTMSAEETKSAEGDDDLATLVQEVHSEFSTAVPMESESVTEIPTQSMVEEEEAVIPREESSEGGASINQSAEVNLEIHSSHHSPSGAESSVPFGTDSSVPSELTENELTS